ncbi:MAG: L-aspartate oxidase [Armatimonadetes bacterium]|nr:L-aspartate oxidase [Armatimonadota bacterium]
MTSESFDYLVIGSGLAGLTFALSAAEHGSVCVLTKAQITESNTNYAQGGIAAAVGEADDWQLHEQDTLTAGAGLCDPEAVRHLVRQAPAAIEWLKGLGARFDLELGREGGHSRSRIVHHADKTGWEVERVVSDAVRRNRAITVYENTFVTSLVKGDGRIVGAVANVSDRGFKQFSGRGTLLATGGVGMLYSRTTNPKVATADGIALAEEAGAEIVDMEFMQFHPTVLYHNQLKSFLVSEAVRGAGGTLRNHHGRRFMYDYDARLELAPRDVVARAIEREIQRLQTWCVYLDTTHLTPERLEEEFPTIWNRLRQIGLEMEKDWMPVTPGQHYSCGGVKTDLSGRTTVPGLWAAGEVARTGVHGANRLASNSLLEAIVFATAAASDVRSAPPAGTGQPVAAPSSVPESEAVRIRHGVQRTMTDCAGVFRTDAGLTTAAERIRSLRNDYDRQPEATFSTYSLETRNLLITARLTVDSAIARKENVGLHYNADQAKAEEKAPCRSNPEAVAPTSAV